MSAPRRLFCPALPQGGGEVTLPADAARHLRVLRAEVGDRLVLFDGGGREADARLEALTADGARARADAPRQRPRPRPRIVLCQSIAKGGKLDAIVRSTTELGVAAIHFVEAERSVSRHDPERFARRMGRLSKIAREAARQSGRADVPDLVPPAPLDDVLARAPREAARLAAVVGATEAEAIEVDEVWILIGPEGGLSDAEVDRAGALGFAPTWLGPHTLRVETAAPVACAVARERARSPKNRQKSGDEGGRRAR